MNVDVIPAGPEQRGCVEALLQLYVYDLSEMFGVDVGDDGRFRPPAIDGFWAEPGHEAFLLRADGHLAGFALVRNRSRLTGAEGVFDMVEFFVLRRFRRHGVGERAATWLFGRFPGTWEVRQRAVNVAATAFWRRAIGRYTDGRFEDLRVDDERWRGPAQRFEGRVA